MAEFALNTSGAVPLRHTDAVGQTFISTLWTDLDAFTQGYIEALIVDAVKARWPSLDEHFGADLIAKGARFGFSDLAPETLAEILKDCADVGDYAEFFADDPGASFWLNRQRGWPAWSDRQRRRFPPLTPTLGDDGKVYLREAA